MSSQLKNIITVFVPEQTTVDVPHGLNTNGLPVKPDVIFLDSSAVEVDPNAVTATTIPVFNPGTDITLKILCEHWHSLERAFGDQFKPNLVPQPFIVFDEKDIPTPAFNPNTVTIYARLTGSDITGKGTLALPYRTFQRAIRDVPNIIPPGAKYIVDCTGIGVEVLPADFIMPTWKSAQNMNGYDFTYEFFYISAAVRILANPKLASALAPADAVIDAAVITADPVTGHRTYTVGAARAGWAGDALKGLLAHGGQTPFPDSFANARIIASTATSITVLSDYDWQFPIKIMEPSVTLKTTQTDYGFANAGIKCSHQDSLVWGGFDIQADTVNFFQSIAVYGGWTHFECCNLQDFDFEGASPYIETVACLLRADAVGSYLASNFFSLGSLWTGGGFFWAIPVASAGSQLFNSDFDGCSPVNVIDGQIANSIFENGFSDGVNGSQEFFVNSYVRDNAGYGVKITDNRSSHMQNVVGTGNGTGLAPGEQVGVKADNGAQVEVGDGVTVEGSGPAFGYKAGDLPAAAWPGAPFSAYDITVVVAGGATGTGARIYELP